VDNCARNSASRVNQACRLDDGALGGTALSLATARPWLVMTTSSPCWTKLTSRNRSDWVCSTVAVMEALKHFG
jgi:hypothetical protein